MSNKPVDNVDTPPTVELEVDEVSVRDFRLRFSGADAYTVPVEVTAYGRSKGYFFPPGTLPACIAPRRRGYAHERRGLPNQGVPTLPARRDPNGPSPTTREATSLSEKQQQRDAWLRKISRSRVTGSGYG